MNVRRILITADHSGSNGQVQALAGVKVLHCACGVWHTAAVAQDRPLGNLNAMASLTYLEGRALQQKLADMYDAFDEVNLSYELWCMLPARACSNAAALVDKA